MEYQKRVNAGPRTSIEHLTNVHFRAHSALVAMGAWTTIALVAFDPFVQQLVAYRSELVFQNNPGVKIALAQRWSGGTELLQLASGGYFASHYPLYLRTLTPLQL